MLDNIMCKTLHKELGNKDYNQRLKESSQVIYNVCMRIYGVKEKNNKPPVKKKRRQRMKEDLRMKKRNLKKQIRFTNIDERESLLKIWLDLKKKKEKKNTHTHSALCKAENLWKRRVKRRKGQEYFSKNNTNMRGTYLINRN